MSGISVNIIVFLITGIPQGLLSVLAVQIFTGTKIDIKKYLLLSLICIATTYLIRFLPIAIGVNTVLTLMVLIIAFQFVYKTQLSKVIRIIASAAVAFVLIAIAEILNMLLLIAIYGQATAEELFNSTDGLVRSIHTTPSNIFFAILIFIGYLILKKIEKRKKKDGEACSKTGE